MIDIRYLTASENKEDTDTQDEEISGADRTPTKWSTLSNVGGSPWKPFLHPWTVSPESLLGLQY